VSKGRRRRAIAGFEPAVVEDIHLNVGMLGQALDGGVWLQAQADQYLCILVMATY
jgi:hypothetical protein